MEILREAFPGIELSSMVKSEEEARGKLRKKIFSSSKDKLKKDFFGFFIELFYQQPLGLKEFIDDLEKCIILSALSKVGGNQKKAARALGIKYTTLNEKIKRYNIRFQKISIGSPWNLEGLVD
jgi:DNA-binding NtrC family response regulator